MACIVGTNDRRKQLGIRYLLRNFPAESCADKAALAASRAATTRSQCKETAQNVCSGRGAPADVAKRCVDEIFREGPGAGAAHARYTNAISTTYPLVSCGFATKPDGTVFMVQSFGEP